jgi:DNA-binding TFAR19-related protein (PDSD5 family)
MGIRKRKNKVDFIEDYLGTEALSGTYEEREKVAKMLKAEKAWVEELNRRKIEEIRKKKIEELQLKNTDNKKVIEIYQKCDYVLQHTLEMDAYLYLNMIRETEPAVYREMFKLLVPLDDLHKIDEFVDFIHRTGKEPRNKVNLNTIIKYERKVKGIKGKIMVERDGKREPLFGRKVA